MRSTTAVRRRRAEATAIKEIADERSCRSTPVSWAWLDLNQRPHPYQAHSRMHSSWFGDHDQLNGRMEVTVVVRSVPRLSV